MAKAQQTSFNANKASSGGPGHENDEDRKYEIRKQ
jgi:hypothetical protein